MVQLELESALDALRTLNLHSWIYRFGISLLAVLVLALRMEANANENFLVSCPIKRGDSLAKVKGVFQITEEPKQENLVPGRYSYHFPAYGISIFFDSAKFVETLRFDSPFAGKIEGVSIGDAKEKLCS